MSKNKLKVGIFSGSFNPIHIGHLALANYLCEFNGLDEVWFVVTPQNPCKTRGQLLDDELRLRMVQKAIHHYPKFKASDFEFHLPRPSYSINTLKALQVAYPDYIFYFIIGADNWDSISSWKNYSLLMNNYNLLIYPRKDYAIHIPKEYPNIHAVNAPIIEISSTFIRNAIRDGKDMRFFLPTGVYEMCEFAFLEK